MLKVVIVDDEDSCLQFNRQIIENHFEEIEIVGQADSVVSGIKEILHKKPDLVLLDIDIKGGSGFDILDSIPDRNFKVIFITAFNQYAIKAFRFSAVNYILKPVDPQELVLAINKIKETIGLQENYKVLLENLKNGKPGKIAIPTRDGLKFKDVNNILRLEAEGRYTHVYFDDDKAELVSRNLGEFQDLLDDNIFFRTHKSHIINVKFVNAFIKSDGGFIKMFNGDQVPIAASKKDVFLEYMEKETRFFDNG